jgi:hypothetical protein
MNGVYFLVANKEVHLAFLLPYPLQTRYTDSYHQLSWDLDKVFHHAQDIAGEQKTTKERNIYTTPHAVWDVQSV